MLYGLIGRKLGHSFSARYFNDKFVRENIAARYELFEIPSVNTLSPLIDSHPDLRGFNVTIPYKKDIIPLLSSLTDSARRIGAVNTVRVLRPAEPLYPGAPRVILAGHNTDAPGFREALLPLLPPPADRHELKALILGSGGASKAVIYALEELGIKPTIVSRHSGVGQLTYADLDEKIMRDHRLIVNCTPLGMWPETDTYPRIPYEFLDSSHICFDLVYNPEVTEFMRRAESRGAVVSNGLQMLINQANLAWEFWQTPLSRRYLSRRVELHHHDGSVERHPLSVAEIFYDASDAVTAVSISPFSEEIHSVEYLDTPLLLHLP